MNEHLLRGELLLEAHRYEDAKGEFLRALAEAPEEPWCHSRYAVCCSMLGQHAEALGHALEAVSLEPDNPGLHHNLGWCFSCSGDKGAAVRSAQAALRCDPDYLESHHLIGCIELGRGNYVEAKRRADAILAIDPQSSMGFRLRGLAAKELGEAREAVEDLHSALRLAPEDALTHAGLGWTRLYEGKIRAAEYHFREALRQNPYDEDAKIGALETLKSRNLFYRNFLKYLNWLNRDPPGKRWILAFLACMIGSGIVHGFQLSYDAHAWMIHLGPLVFIFATSEYLIRPAAHALTSFNSIGRFLLSPWERYGGALLSLIVLIDIGLIVVGATLRSERLLTAAALVGYSYLPLLQTWRSAWPGIRVAMGCLAALVTGLAGTIVYLASVSTSPQEDNQAVALGLLWFFLAILSMILPNLIYLFFYAQKH